MAMLHRQFGKLLTRSADDASVAILITEVDITEKRLEKVQSFHVLFWGVIVVTLLGMTLMFMMAVD